jgi:hypothetical protein
MSGVTVDLGTIAVTARVPAGIPADRYEVVILATSDGVNEPEWTAYAALPGGRRVPLEVTVEDSDEDPEEGVRA